MDHFNPSDYLYDDIEADPRCDLDPDDFPDCDDSADSAGSEHDDDWEALQYTRDLNRSHFGIKDI